LLQRLDPREITQRELRNNSGDVMRALDHGESFVVTRDGVPVGELTPLRTRRFVSAEAAVAAFAGAPAIAADRFRSDVDAVLDHDRGSVAGCTRPWPAPAGRHAERDPWIS
jgi:antitoxin (DNA-binding transcriptional repressor) of toxin-antitoxin stability system